LNSESLEDDLQFSDDFLASASTAREDPKEKSTASSEKIAVKLTFPGNEYERPKRSSLKTGRIFF
jgi:hypothetical protein